MKELKDGERKQNKILLAPVIAYMLAGYGLLFSVYRLELFAEKICGYCHYFRPLNFSVTAWHESQMWISLLFPLTWPVLGLRALMLLLLASSCAALEILFKNLGQLYSRIWRQILLLGSSVRRVVLQIANLLRRGIRTVADALMGWLRLVWRVIYSGLSTLSKGLLTVADDLVRLLIPVAHRFWLVVTGPFRQLHHMLVLTARQVAFWIRLSLSTLWRALRSAGFLTGSWMRYLGRQLLAAIRITGIWTMTALHIFGGWVLIPLRWFWAGLVDIKTLVVQVSLSGWRWAIQTLRTIRAWVLIPLRWFWAGLVDIKTLVVQVSLAGWHWAIQTLRTISAWLTIPFLWFWQGLVELRKPLVYAGNLIWQGLASFFGELWRWILIPLRHLWAGLLFAWKQIGVSAAIVWTWLTAAGGWLWSQSLAIWTVGFSAVRLVWQSAIRFIATISLWTAARWRQLWRRLSVAWLAIRDNLHVALSRLLEVLLQAWELAAWVLITLWKPVQAASLTFLSLLRSARKRVRLLLKLAWSPFKALGAMLAQIWEQTRETFSTAFRQLIDLLSQVRVALTEQLKRLFRSTGFWKRVFANLRLRQSEIMVYLATLRASLSAPLREIKKQLAPLLSGTIEKTRALVVDFRRWLEEFRDQIRHTAGESRQRVSEIREETVETLRHIVPRGRS